jgi:hypothetical protein
MMIRLDDGTDTDNGVKGFRLELLRDSASGSRSVRYMNPDLVIACTTTALDIYVSATPLYLLLLLTLPYPSNIADTSFPSSSSAKKTSANPAHQ